MQHISPLEMNSTEINEIKFENLGEKEPGSSKHSDHKDESLSNEVIIKKYCSSLPSFTGVRI